MLVRINEREAIEYEIIEAIILYADEKKEELSNQLRLVVEDNNYEKLEVIIEYSKPIYAEIALMKIVEQSRESNGIDLSEKAVAMWHDQREMHRAIMHTNYLLADYQRQQLQMNNSNLVKLG